MNRKDVLCAVRLAAVLAVGVPVSVLADDSAASIAAGGLIPRRETRIVMAKEVLRISDKKVAVDYDFRNNTDENVTTEVAFPVPPYKNEFPEGSVPEQSFQSFRLWVDEKPARFDLEATATLKGKDVTEILKANRIDIPTFGHFEDKADAQHSELIATRDFDRLPTPIRQKLLKAGLFDDQGSLIYALWTAYPQYHWTQTFPAHSIVHIRHEYTPAVGFEMMPSAAEAFQLALQPVDARKSGKLEPQMSETLGLLAGFCADPGFLRVMSRAMKGSASEDIVYPHWVDFILTTANTWQRPIEDFTLIVERPKPRLGRRDLISFCSPGTVEKLDPDYFQVHLSNFVPTSELHIGFFEVPLAKPAQPAGKK